MMNFVYTIHESWDEKDIVDMIDQGISCFRINAARSTEDRMTDCIHWIRSIAKKRMMGVKIFYDLPGSKARVWYKPTTKRAIKSGESISILRVNQPDMSGMIQMTGTEIFRSFHVGDRMSIRRLSYPLMVFRVIAIECDHMVVRAETDALIGWGYQAINDERYTVLTSLSDADRTHIDIVQRLKPDVIGVSFADSAGIIIDLRSKLSLMGKNMPMIFAKIETAYAVNNLGEIMDHVEGVIIGRDDLLVWYQQREIDSIVDRVIAMCAQKHLFSVPASNYFQSIGSGFPLTYYEAALLKSLMNQEASFVYINETNKNPLWRMFYDGIIELM